MRGVWLRARADARRHLLSWLGLVVLIGLTGGAAIAIVAGARRTDTAYQRFLTSSAASDIAVVDSNDFLTEQIDLDRVTELPAVKNVARASLLFFVGSTKTGKDLTTNDFVPIAGADTRLGSTIDRWKLLDGRRADPQRIDEAVLDFEAADRLGLEVGDTLTLRLFRENTFAAKVLSFLATVSDRVRGAIPPAKGGFTELADGPVVNVHIVGIEANPIAFPPVPGALRSWLHLTPAFYARFVVGVSQEEILMVRLRPQASLAEFKAAIERIGGSSTVFYGVTQAKHTANVERSLHLQAVVLWLLAGLIVGASLLVVAQALIRQGQIESLDDRTLRAIGMIRRELWAVGLARTAAIAVAGAAAAAGLAVLVSPLFPVGLARVAEPAPGVDVNLALVGGGFVAIVVLVMFAGAISSWRSACGGADTDLLARHGRVRPRAIMRFLQRSRLPLPAVLGARHALERQRGARGTAVPVWTTAVASTIAVATLVAAATFGASLNYLLDTPRLYGWSWDAQVGGQGLPDVGAQIGAGLADNASISDFAAGTVLEVDIEGVRVEAFAVDPVKGVVSPALLAGRAPDGPREIVLGSKTLERLGVDVGNSVDVRIGDHQESFEVVGRAVFTNIGDTGQLGRGAFLTLSALEQSVPDPPHNIVLVRIVPGRDRAEALSRLRRAVAPLPMASASLPTDLVSFGRVDNLPLLVAAVLGALAAAVLAHTLITTIHRRRRELAILKTLGFRRRQVAGTVAGQATTLAVIALAVGIPLGTIIGRVAWSRFAAAQGISSAPTVDVGAIALFVPAIILAALVVAAIPAWLAARVSPATALRGE